MAGSTTKLLRGTSTAWMLVLFAGCSWHQQPFPAAPVTGEGDIVRRSNLELPAGDAFELGGGHVGSLSVRVENVGPAAVEVMTEKGPVAIPPGQTLDAVFDAGTVARLENPTGRRAMLKVVYVKRDPRPLGMGYVELP